ncbi:LysE family translocator [Amycolatopsis sp. WAC 01375]|uniref:LysE family translocator n=1 Tax=Amycolatopsis sp. WAC 01375 TaxID=2203194 RepID=UPI001F228AB0|nr:LysE family transporter [Amycolatopsis sp. WAC 01375]
MPNLLAFVPGPATVMLIKQSAKGSRRNASATVAGIEAGIAFWGLAAVFGLTALLVASPVAYDILRIAGAVFLINVSNPKASAFAISFLPQLARLPGHTPG